MFQQFVKLYEVHALFILYLLVVSIKSYSLLKALPVRDLQTKVASDQTIFECARCARITWSD